MPQEKARAKWTLKVHVVSLFPEMFTGPLSESMLKRAKNAGLIDVELIDLRAFADDVHHTADDSPYGGGAGMVLKPVDRLLETSRQLTGEQFDHRPTPEQKDEFGELADGYNKLAGLLQAEEQRRMEMIGQVALTMNHELNNAIAGIEMQIQLLSRRSGADDRFESGLRRIRESLRRMAQTVESLKRIRRIVLTDYIAGVKMLDLQRSTEDTSDRTERVSESAENA